MLKEKMGAVRAIIAISLFIALVAYLSHAAGSQDKAVGAEIKGIVIDANDGKPLVGVMIALNQSPFTWEEGIDKKKRNKKIKSMKKKGEWVFFPTLMSTKTDKEGRFTFRGITEGNYALTVDVKRTNIYPPQDFVKINGNLLIIEVKGQNNIFELKIKAGDEGAKSGEPNLKENKAEKNPQVAIKETDIQKEEIKTKKYHQSMIVKCIKILGGGENIKAEDILNAMDTLDWYGPMAIDPLIQVLESTEKNDEFSIARKLNIIRVLGWIGDKKASEPLKEIRDSEKSSNKEKEFAKESLNHLEKQRIWFNRKSYQSNDIVIYALTKRSWKNEKKSIDFISNALKAFNWEVRLEALVALLFSSEKTDIAIIIKLLKDNSINIRVNAAAVLAIYKDSTSLDALIGALNDKAWSVRLNTIKALIAIGDSKAIESIKKLKKDPDKLVRESARKALKILKKGSIR